MAFARVPTIRVQLSLVHGRQQVVATYVASTHAWSSLDEAFTHMQPPLMQLLLHAAIVSRLWQSLPTRGRHWIRLLPT
ncbi:hypothetical protein B296_00000409 [Ensete ventricosum]|uniref:Uncharacterized protein n=1 Tax=Ensete ventricosum TaxID=4639 RepID=A0A427B0S3_ENSVE|nr:hypothetical protein B296_00000409 [Ensete ventricosum]